MERQGSKQADNRNRWATHIKAALAARRRGKPRPSNKTKHLDHVPHGLSLTQKPPPPKGLT